MRPTRARMCRCPRPNRAEVDGVPYCEDCGELLPDSTDDLLAVLVKSQADLMAKVDELHRAIFEQRDSGRNLRDRDRQAGGPEQ